MFKLIKKLFTRKDKIKHRVCFSDDVFMPSPTYMEFQEWKEHFVKVTGDSEISTSEVKDIFFTPDGRLCIYAPAVSGPYPDESFDYFTCYPNGELVWDDEFYPAGAVRVDDYFLANNYNEYYKPCLKFKEKGYIKEKVR